MGTPLRATASSNTATVITITAVTGTAHEIEMLGWSYDAGGTLSGGRLTVESPSGTYLFDINVTAAGAGFIPFSGSTLRGASGQAVIITLAAGGSGVVGKVNAIQRAA
jgi:hypothetical protein